MVKAFSSLSGFPPLSISLLGLTKENTSPSVLYKKYLAYKQNTSLLNGVIYLFIPRRVAKKRVISKPQVAELLPKALVVALRRDSGV